MAPTECKVAFSDAEIASAVPAAAFDTFAQCRIRLIEVSQQQQSAFYRARRNSKRLITGMSVNSTGNTNSAKKKRKRINLATRNNQLTQQLLNTSSTTPPAGRTRSATGDSRGGKTSKGRKGAQPGAPRPTTGQQAATGGEEAQAASPQQQPPAPGGSGQEIITDCDALQLLPAANGTGKSFKFDEEMYDASADEEQDRGTNTRRRGDEAKRVADFDKRLRQDDEARASRPAEEHLRTQRAQEAALRVKQITRADNQEREALVRASQEAEAHATRERLRKLQTQLAEKELNKAAESRTQKVPAHLVLKPEHCQSVSAVAVHLHKLNSEPEKDRVSYLKQGVGDIPLTREQEQLPWSKLVPNVLKNMSQDYLQILQELILSPRSQTSITMLEFNTLKHSASTAVTTHQWLLRLENQATNTTEEVEKMTARMILHSVPVDIRNHAKVLLTGRKDKEPTIASITAILDNIQDAPAALQPRYGTPTRRNTQYQPPSEQYAAPIQGSPPWTPSNLERLIQKTINDRLQTLSPAQEWTPQQAPWTPTQGCEPHATHP
jgi:hypothetical protein